VTKAKTKAIARGFTIIELMIVVVIIGLLVTIALPNFISMKDRAREAGTRENAHTLQLAAEDFASGNDGVYSTNAADITPLLPGAGMMINSFTGVNSEPQFGAAAGTPGQIGLESVINGGVVSGYKITGFGRADLIVTLVTAGN